MVPYDLHTLGDHCRMMIDLDIQRLLKSNQEKDTNNIGRKLPTNNQQVTEKYLTLVEEGFEQQNIIGWVKKTYHQWKKKKCSK